MDQCQGIMGRIFGHNFKGRYDTQTDNAPPVEALKSIVEKVTMTDEYLSDVLEKIHDLFYHEKSTYLGDVCTRCGIVLDRQQGCVADTSKT